MEYRILGRSGLRVSVLGIGGGVFNTQKDPSVNLATARKVISTWIDHGVNLIDIGKEYDEELITKGLGKSSSKVHFIIRSEANSVKKIKNDIQDSLKKFKIRKIDVYEVFVWEKKDVEKLQNSGVLDFLEEAKRRKLIGCIGIFSHRIEVIKYGLDLYDFDVVSTLYNPIHRLAETLFKTIEKRNLGMISIAPFATGILVDPKYDENIRKEGVEFMNVSNVFNFILSSKYVHSIIVGSKRKQHILENIDAISRRVQLNERERNEISKKMLEFIGKDSCRMCRYCERCPKGVPIADLLKLHILATSYGYKDFVKWQFKFFEEKIRKCDSCGLCEKVCPYNVPIRKKFEELKELVGE